MPAVSGAQTSHRGGGAPLTPCCPQLKPVGVVVYVWEGGLAPITPKQTTTLTTPTRITCGRGASPRSRASAVRRPSL